MTPKTKLFLLLLALVLTAGTLPAAALAENGRSAPAGNINEAAAKNEGTTVSAAGKSAAADLTLSDLLQFDPNALLFDFESGDQGWTAIDGDGDGHNWVQAADIPSVYPDASYSPALYCHNSNNAFASFSYIVGVGELNTNNYLVSPKLTLGNSLFFYVRSMFINHPENMSVSISLGGCTDPDDFVTLKAWEPLQKDTDWHLFFVDLSEYAGMEGYIAFRDYASSKYGVSIDDVVISDFCLVTFDYMGHGGTNTVQLVAAGEKISPPEAPTDLVRNFGGWYREASCQTPWDFDADPVTRSITLYAKWSLDPGILYFDFEDGAQGWTVIDGDGDGYNWMLVSDYCKNILNSNENTSSLPHNESKDAFISFSYLLRYGTPLNTDNYLVSPRVTLGGEISFYARCPGEKYKENLRLMVSTGSPDDPNDFVEVTRWEPFANTEWQLFTVDLSGYEGEGYIAFRDVTEDHYVIFVDDVIIKEGCVVTFDPQGRGTAPAPQYVVYGGKVARPDDPTDPVYAFAGWYKEPECVNPWDFDTDTVKDMRLTLYGKWAESPIKATYDFETGAQGWTVFGAGDDDDEYNWMLATDFVNISDAYSYQSSEVCHTGENGFVSASFIPGIGSFPTDNFLVSPRVVLGGSVSFYARNNSASYPENLGLWVSTGSGSSAKDFVEAARWEPLPNDEWQLYTVNLSAYEGEGYIAFRDYAYGQFFIMVDDVTILEKCVVTFDTQGRGTAPGPQYVYYGDRAARPDDPAAAGYTFGGWYKDAECENPWDFDADTVDEKYVTLFAKWTTDFPVTDISLDQSAITVEIGGVSALTAELTPANASDPTVVWSVSGSAAKLYLDAECTQHVGAEPTSQLTVYVQGVALGSAAVTVASHENAEISASCAVEVKTWTVYVGDHESGSSGIDLPVSTCYNYSFTQQLFLPEEMGTAGTITSLTFEYVGPNNFTMEGIRFYLAHVEEEAISSGFLSMADAQLVYTGPLTMNGAGNVTVVLDKPFAYDGISTLMLAGYDPTNGYFSGSDQFRYTAGFANRTAYYQSDITCPAINDDGTVSKAPDERENYRSNVEFGFSEKHTPVYADVEGIELSTTSLELAKNGVAALTAKVLPKNADKRVIWSVEGTSAALYLDEACTQPVGDEATNVRKVYVKGLSKGTAVVTAASAENSAVATSCAVTVLNTTDIDVGDPNSGNTSNCLPVYLYYNYSLTQQIFEASEIGTAGTINALTFYYTYDQAFSKPSVSFYLGHTAKSSFESDTDMVSMDQFTLVYNGVFSASGAGLVTVYLDTPFEYNGLDNLILCVFQPTSGHLSNSMKFRTTETAHNSGIIYLSDSYLPDLTNVNSYSGGHKTLNYHNTIKFTMSSVHTPGVTLLESVALDPAELTIAVDQVAPLTAVPTPDNANEPLIWSVEGDAVELYLDAECTQPVGADPVDAYTVYVKGAAPGSASVTVTGSESEATSDARAVTVSSVASVTYEGVTTYYTSLSDALQSWTGNTTLTLLANVETTDFVLSERVHTLDLNGHGIVYVGTDNSDSVLRVIGGTLTVKDGSSGTNTVYFDDEGRGALSGTGEGVTVGGFLTGGRSGGIFVQSGTLILEGGTILGNLKSGGVGGAGVRVNNGAAFQMRGGLITKNTSVGAGGGVGVCAREGAQGSFEMTGGQITDNRANGNGAGVIFQPGALFRVGGSARITGNTQSDENHTPNNVWMPDGMTLSVIQPLDDSAAFALTMENPGVFTASDDTAYNDAEKFTSDAAGYEVTAAADGQLQLAPPPVAVTGVTLDPAEGQTITVGESIVFTADIEPGDATDKTVIWSVGGANPGAVKLYADENCAEGSEIGEDATETLIVFAKGVSAGSAAVTVTSVSDPSLSAACSVRVTPDSPVIVGYRLRLGGVLGLKCYVDLPLDFDETDANAKMTFTLPSRDDQVIPLTAAGTETVGGCQYRVFECSVYAYQMADDITAAFTWGEGESVSDTTNLETYLALVLDGAYDDAVKALAAATANYGHYIQPYLANLNGWTVGGKYAEMPAVSELTQADMDAAFTATGSKAFSLNGTYDAAKLDNVICYLTLDADTKLTVKVGLKGRYADAAATVNTPNGVCSVSGKVCKVVIPNIAANCLGEVYTVAVTADGGPVISFNISPLSCVHAMLNAGAQTTDAEKLAYTAMYRYWVAAEAYIGAGN